jgi:hypothetical protein
MPVFQNGYKEWDVIVVGGGTAGVAAAISAARAGADTLLVERSDILGGNATQAFVHTFCGLFLPPAHGEYSYANPGFTERLAKWLMGRGGAFPPEVHGKVAVLPTCPEKMADLLQEACAAVSGLEIAYSTRLQELRPLEEGGFSCTLASAPAEAGCRARFMIDTSGDAYAAEMIGVPTEISLPGELQHATFIFRVSGANPGDLEGYQRLKLTATFTRGARSGLLPPECDSVLVRPTGTPGEAFVSLNMPKPAQEIYNPLDEGCLRNMEAMARGRAAALIQFLRQEMPGWQACDVLEWPRRLGVRETRRIRGRYTMTAEDILEGHQFENQVAFSTWPIELWSRHTGAEFRYPTGPCGIPLDALISAGHSRLGMAGRCMSATHEALGALRVMGTAMATGEAIGLATALAAARNSALDSISSQEIRDVRQSIHLNAGEQP